MVEVAERVNNLEDALMKLAYAQFNTEIELRLLAKEARDFREEMQEFKEEMETDRQASKAEMKEFKDEMKEFKDEMKDFKAEMYKFRKDSNKKWGELANKMGTITEDIVAPNIPRIAKDYFGCEHIDFSSPRIEKCQPGNPAKKKEFDVIAISGDYIFLNETKSTVRDSYIRDFISFLENDEFFLYFPEYQGKTIIPVFAALSIPDDKVRYLSRQGIYAMSMTDTTMDLVNFDEVRKN